MMSLVPKQDSVDFLATHLLYFFNPYERYIMQRQYGCLAFLFDIFMCFLTGGLWLIWIFVREMRRR